MSEKTKNTAPKTPRTPKAVIESELCDLLAGRPSPRLLNSAPPFPHKFLVVRPEVGGAPIILKVEDNVAKIVIPEYAAGYLREYVSYLSGDVAEFNVTYDTCTRIIKSWSHQFSDLTTFPKAVAFKSDPELCMTRLPFDPAFIDDKRALSANAPLFSEMLARMKNSDAFVLRVGSLFDPDADRKQAVWMSGPRDCGKSEFAWLLMELAGKSYGILSNTDLKTDYWKAQLVGKRVGIVQEAAARFIRSDEFKAITGDDEHSINQKNQPIYYAKIPAMMFFFSNNPPEIPHDDALIARIIDCRIEAIPQGAMLPKSVVRQKIREEFPFIAGYCLGAYQALGSGDRIPCGSETLSDTVEKYEADYIDFLEHHFIADPDKQILRRDFKQTMDEEGIKSSLAQAICKRVFLARFKVAEVRITFETNDQAVEKRVFVYQGVRFREESEKQFKDKVSAASHAMPIKEANVTSIRPASLARPWLQKRSYPIERTK